MHQNILLFSSLMILSSFAADLSTACQLFHIEKSNSAMESPNSLSFRIREATDRYLESIEGVFKRIDSVTVGAEGESETLRGWKIQRDLPSAAAQVVRTAISHLSTDDGRFIDQGFKKFPLTYRMLLVERLVDIRELSGVKIPGGDEKRGDWLMFTTKSRLHVELEDIKVMPPALMRFVDLKAREDILDKRPGYEEELVAAAIAVAQMVDADIYPVPHNLTSISRRRLAVSVLSETLYSYRKINLTLSRLVKNDGNPVQFDAAFGLLKRGVEPPTYEPIYRKLQRVGMSEGLLRDLIRANWIRDLARFRESHKFRRFVNVVRLESRKHAALIAEMLAGVDPQVSAEQAEKFVEVFSL